MKKIYYSLGLLTLLFVVSCSSESPKPQTKTYSSSTLKEFEAIEKSDVATPNKTPYIPQGLTPVVKKVSVSKEVKKEESTQLIPANKLNPKSQERLQEINQNLAFYCMKHRKDSAFSSEENCLKYTQVVLNYCEKKHKIINTVMVNCIKDKLKKRRQ